MAGRTEPGTEGGNESQRVIYVLVNRLSLFLKTKRDVNRAIDAIRFLLKRKIKQRQNGQRIRDRKQTEME